MAHILNFEYVRLSESIRWSCFSQFFHPKWCGPWKSVLVTLTTEPDELLAFVVIGAESQPY